MASDTKRRLFPPSALGRAHHSACVHRIRRQTEALRAQFFFAVSTVLSGRSAHQRMRRVFTGGLSSYSSALHRINRTPRDDLAISLWRAAKVRHECQIKGV